MDPRTGLLAGLLRGLLRGLLLRGFTAHLSILSALSLLQFSRANLLKETVSLAALVTAWDEGRRERDRREGEIEEKERERERREAYREMRQR